MPAPPPSTIGALISPICSPEASFETATDPAPDGAASPLLVVLPAAGAVVAGAGAGGARLHHKLQQHYGRPTAGLFPDWQFIPDGGAYPTLLNQPATVSAELNGLFK